MKQRFFVFVACKVGKPREIARAIQSIDVPFVTEVSLTSGKWDIVIRAECDNMADVGNALVTPIQTIAGVNATKTEIGYAIYDPEDVFF